jgi:hypothetical protein
MRTAAYSGPKLAAVAGSKKLGRAKGNAVFEGKDEVDVDEAESRWPESRYDEDDEDEDDEDVEREAPPLLLLLPLLR